MKQKRKINYFRLLLMAIIPLLIIGVLFYGIKQFGNSSKESETSQSIATQSDLTTLLTKSMQPIGKVMYVWGGGWNEEDTGSGSETRQLGLASTWQSFANRQDASYNVEDHLYEIHNGLDCSGYIGWLLYNTFETENGKTGYVHLSNEIGPSLEQKGFGHMIAANSIETYEPGDLLANKDHIFMVIAQCEDGSLLIAHSSPPGVRICGTPTLSGDPDSQALALAQKIMSTQFPDWYAKYPDCSCDFSFLSDYDQFRWNSNKLKDENSLRNKSAQEIVSVLFPSLVY